MDPIVGREIPGLILAGSALAGKAGASEGSDVEVAMKCRNWGSNRKVRLGFVLGWSWYGTGTSLIVPEMILLGRGRHLMSNLRHSSLFKTDQ